MNVPRFIFKGESVDLPVNRLGVSLKPSVRKSEAQANADSTHRLVWKSRGSLRTQRGDDSLGSELGRGQLNRFSRIKTHVNWVVWIGFSLDSEQWAWGPCFIHFCRALKDEPAKYLIRGWIYG